MPESSSNETLEAVADELASLGKRLSDLSETVRAQTAPAPLSGRGTGQPDAQPAPSASPPQEASPRREPEPPPAGSVPASPGGLARTRFWEQWTASRVLAWSGGAVTLLGVTFLLILAVQRGWLSPAFRVAGGAGLGAALIGAAVRVHRGGAARAAGSALAATGCAALYLDAVAATSLYGYLPLLAGLGTGLLVAAGGLWLADRWDSQTLAVGAVLGCAACSPLITQSADALLVGFLVLLQVAAAPVQLRNGWRWLALTAALPAVLAALVADARALMLPGGPATVVAALGVSVVGAVLATLMIRARPHDIGPAVGVLVSAPAPALLAAALVERTGAGFLAAGVGMLMLAVCVATRFAPGLRTVVPSRFAVAAGGAAAVAALQATLTFVAPSAWATVLLCEALLLTLGARQLRSAATLLGAVCYAGIGFCVAQVHDVPAANLLRPSAVDGPAEVLVGLLIAGVAIAIPVTAVRLGAVPKPPGARPLWMFSGVLLLYGTASATMAVALLVRPDWTGFLAGHVLITLSWVLAAIALLLRGIRVAHLRVAGLVLLPVSLAKLFLFDLATLDGFARVVAFLCTGLVLLAAGVRYARLLAGGSNGNGSWDAAER